MPSQPSQRQPQPSSTWTAWGCSLRGMGLQPRRHMGLQHRRHGVAASEAGVAASEAGGCSIGGRGLQHRRHRVAASEAWGCSIGGRGLQQPQRHGGAASIEPHQPFSSGQEERGGAAAGEQVGAERRCVGHGCGRHLRGERAVGVDDLAQPPLCLGVGGAEAALHRVSRRGARRGTLHVLERREQRARGGVDGARPGGVPTAQRAPRGPTAAVAVAVAAAGAAVSG